VWSSFFAAVTARNRVAATLALHTITEVHIGLFDDGWERFVEWDYPLFDPIAGLAPTRLARHHGLVTNDSQIWTAATWTPVWPRASRLRYPGDWPKPSPVAHTSAG
jgi:hypothetical protein